MADEVEKAPDQQEPAGEEQSPDQAASTSPGVETPTDDSPEAVELIGQEQFDSLKDNPAALRKELNRAATEKFQELATQRRQLEPYSEFIKALDSDPRATITAIGRKLGLEIKGAEEKSGEEIANETTDRITESVRKHLGPEYEDLADRLAPAIRHVAEEVAKQYAAPIVRQQEELIRDSALRESRAVIDNFTKQNPQWQKHEKAMVELSQRLPPGEGMNEMEYMNTLYYLVTRDASEGDAARRIATRMESNARSAGESRRTTVSDGNVSNTPAKPPTFQEAYRAAKEGRRLE